MTTKGTATAASARSDGASTVEVAATHQIAQPLGDRAAPSGVNENVWVSPRTALAALQRTADEHHQEQRGSRQPGLVEELKRRTASTTPMTTPASERPRERHHAGDRRPRRALGPACSDRASSDAGGRADCPATRIIESVARNPAIAHTTVDTIFGLMPAVRARSGFSADARTALPSSVRFRNQPSATATSGTTDQDRQLRAGDPHADHVAPGPCRSPVGNGGAGVVDLAGSA